MNKSQEWFTEWGNNLIKSDNQHENRGFHSTLDVFGSELNEWIVECMKNPNADDALRLPEIAFNYWYNLYTKPEGIAFAVSSNDEYNERVIYLHAAPLDKTHISKSKIQECLKRIDYTLQFVLDHLLITCPANESESREQVYCIYRDICRLTRERLLSKSNFYSKLKLLGYKKTSSPTDWSIKGYKLKYGNSEIKYGALDKLKSFNLEDNDLTRKVISKIEQEDWQNTRTVKDNKIYG